MPASSSTKVLSPRTRCEAAVLGPRRCARARSRFERDGVEIKTLHRCDPEGRDGTELPACFKVYLPAPTGKFGMVPPTRRPSTRSRIGGSTAGCHRAVSGS